MTEESWKPIKGFEGLYSISSLGRVRKEAQILVPNDFTGYHHYTLCNGKVRKAAKAHILVAEHFLEPKSEKSIVHHRDGNKSNNSAENLEFVSYRKNILHAYSSGLRVSIKGEARHNSKLKEKDIIGIRKDYASGINSTVLSGKYGVCSQRIMEIVLKKAWKHVN